MSFAEKTNLNWRVGFRMDIFNVLEEVEDEFRAELKATIESYDTYDECSEETFNDLQICQAKLSMLAYLGYLNEDELTGICEAAKQMRREQLNLLNEKEGE